MENDASKRENRIAGVIMNSSELMNDEDAAQYEQHHQEQLLQQEYEFQQQRKVKMREPTDNTVRLYPNKYKEEGDNKPDFTGNDGLIKGTQVKVAAWKNVSQAGTPYIKITLDFNPDAWKEKKAPVAETKESSEVVW